MSQSISRNQAINKLLISCSFFPSRCAESSGFTLSNLSFKPQMLFFVCFLMQVNFSWFQSRRAIGKQLILWNSSYCGKRSWCWEGVDVPGQGLGSCSGEPGAWLKLAELSGGCSAVCFLWRQDVLALCHLLAALSYSCNRLSCANITVCSLCHKVIAMC